MEPVKYVKMLWKWGLCSRFTDWKTKFVICPTHDGRSFMREIKALEGELLSWGESSCHCKTSHRKPQSITVRMFFIFVRTGGNARVVVPGCGYLAKCRRWLAGRRVPTNLRSLSASSAHGWDLPQIPMSFLTSLRCDLLFK